MRPQFSRHPKRPTWRRYLRFWRADITGDIDDELRFHFEARAADLRARGVPAEDIERIIGEEFGDVEAARQRMREIDARAARRRERAQWWDHLAADLRYALRGLRRSPSFAIAVIVTLAIGVGANAAIFSVIDRMLLRAPAMMRDPARAHRVYTHFPVPDGQQYFTNVPYARYRDLATWSQSFERTALYMDRDLAIGVAEEAREFRVGIVSASFFEFFDAPPAIGRYFGAQEDAPPSGVPVTVLSYGAWQTQYGGRRDVLGTRVQIGPTVYTVIGVAPRGFVGLWPERPPAAFVPFSTFAASFGAMRQKSWTGYDLQLASMLVQRRPRTTIAAADADLTRALLRSWEAETGTAKAPPGWYAVAAPILSERGPNQTAAARVSALVGAMGLLVLLIAGANIANLLLARALRRRREVAMRLALGASRGRLVSQLLVESVVLGLLGGAAGMLVAEWGGLPLRRAFLPAGALVPVLGDARTLAFVGVAVTVVGILAGLAPATLVHRTELTRYLKLGAEVGVGRKFHARVTLLVLQAALSVFLLVGAGLFVRSLVNVRRVRLGYDVAPVLVARLNMLGTSLDSSRAVALRDQLLNTARRVPGVEGAALQFTLPFYSRWLAGLRAPGVDSSALARRNEFYLNAVSPEYFRVMGTRIIRGRGIEAVDAAGAPGAVVVSNAMATLLWPSQDAVGQCLKINADRECRYVVGVAEDIKSTKLSDDAGLYYYLAAAQFMPQNLGLVVRTRGDASGETDAVRRALQQEMPGASYVTVTPFAEVINDETRSWRLGTTMFITYGVVALVLAAVGVFGVIAYDVEQRTHEVGVRVALGAAPADVVWLIVRKGVLTGALGLGIGGAAALAASERVAPLLFGVSAHDPLVYVLVAASLLVATFVASVVPARRATSVDPMVSLRSE